MGRSKEDEERRKRVRTVFDLVSAGYDRSPLRFFREGAERLAGFTDLRPGDRVLDIATGTGWASLAAAKRVGPRGTVTGIDLSPGMIAKARGKARRAGLANLTFRVADAQDPPYRAGAFDAILASQALFFLPDPARALRAWRRLLRPGGRLGISTLGRRAFEPMMGMFWRDIARFGGPRPQPAGPTFETVAEVRRYVRAAGFAGLTTRVVDVGYPLPDVGAWWTIVRHTGMRGGLRRLPEGEVPRFRREHLAAVGELAEGRGIPLPMPMILAAARSPSSGGRSASRTSR